MDQNQERTLQDAALKAYDKGLRHKAHHTQIKKGFRDVLKRDPSKEEFSKFVEFLEDIEEVSENGSDEAEAAFNQAADDQATEMMNEVVGSMAGAAPDSDEGGNAAEQEGGAKPEAEAPKAVAAPKEGVKKIEKPVKTPEQLLAAEKAKNPQRWGKVVRVTDVGTNNNITRVVIKCQNPQKIGDTSVCVDEREIAVQDLFQVSQCEPCKRRSQALARNDKTKNKRAKRRQEVDALNAEMKKQQEVAK